VAAVRAERGSVAVGQAHAVRAGGAAAAAVADAAVAVLGAAGADPGSFCWRGLGRH
jgi:hypothetical protein